MTVKPELRGYTDKDGKQAVFIRISKDGKRKFKATKIKLLKTDWEKGKVKSSHPNYKLYNGIIRKLIVEIEGDSFGPESKPDMDFHKYCLACLNEWEHTKSSETIRQHWSEINKLKTFSPGIKLSSITPAWLVRYKAFCFQKNTENTVHKNMKFVRLIIRKAHRERLIDQNPFDIFEMPKYKDPEKRYLTRDQVDQIEKISRDPELPEQIRFVATWFCISACTGLRFGDMGQFNKKKHIIDNRLVVYTMKTGTPVSMPISNRLKTLFEQIRYQGVNITNIHFNRILKAVGTMCGLGDISAHMARHTAAVMWADSGISQEVTAKLLGHTDLKSTAIYYKITSVRIDDELKKLK